ncbi:hypothetical protein FH972_012701 [Carpinus fangiana]|uniref:Uncharacterized protein n=1 Tax=Carpinus fangiana TaxID=176857 RepID=A0A5N6R4I6_9ROSI|nr:hypothetical protein FH972_012701 [Carpinus fangiana]
MSPPHQLLLHMHNTYVAHADDQDPSTCLLCSPKSPSFRVPQTLTQSHSQLTPVAFNAAPLHLLLTHTHCSLHHNYMCIPFSPIALSFISQ